MTSWCQSGVLKYIVLLNYQVSLIELRVANHGKQVDYNSEGLYPFAASGQLRLCIARNPLFLAARR